MTRFPGLEPAGSFGLEPAGSFALESAGVCR
jgi:hypothetical protein